jgi:Rhs element Vgr protein
MTLALTDTATDVVSYEIKLGGQTIDPSMGVISVVIDRSINRVASAQIMFIDANTDDDDFPLSNQDITKPGTDIEILAGYGDDTTSVFKGIIVKQQLKVTRRKSQLVIECKDKAIQMAMTKKSAYYTEIKDSDVFTQLIAGYGLVTDIENTSVQHKELIQFNCTDWDFIVMRAEMNGQFVLTIDGKIKIMKPPVAGAPLITASYGNNIYELETDMDARTQLKEVKVSGWDSANQSLAEESSTEPSIVQDGNISGTDLAASIYDKTFKMCHSGRIAQDELKAWADAKLLKSRLAKVRGRVKIQGTKDANPGDVILLDGIGDRFNGNVIATAVRHEISIGNWLTDIQFGNSSKWYAEEMQVNEPPAAAMLPAVQGLQIAVVTALENDPEGEFRIKVRIPVISTTDEGSWARLAATDAGNNRGMVIRPEIGDEVVVGFINNDPRHIVVLGALHSSKNNAPIEAKDDNNEKGWITRSEMKLILNDDKKSILLSTPADNKIQISEDDKSILIKDQNGNKLQMNSDGVTIESAKDIVLKATGDIKMEAINIQGKASGSWKAEGSASLEIKSSGSTSVKGSTVQIN